MTVVSYFDQIVSDFLFLKENSKFIATDVADAVFTVKLYSIWFQKSIFIAWSIENMTSILTQNT